MKLECRQRDLLSGRQRYAGLRKTMLKCWHSRTVSVRKRMLVSRQRRTTRLWKGMFPVISMQQRMLISRQRRTIGLRKMMLPVVQN
jgi:hypothetical protein